MLRGVGRASPVEYLPSLAVLSSVPRNRLRIRESADRTSDEAMAVPRVFLSSDKSTKGYRGREMGHGLRGRGKDKLNEWMCQKARHGPGPKE